LQAEFISELIWS